MAKSVFDAPQFKTEEGAFAYVEAHLWPNGPVCPHCGNCDQARIRKMEGKTTRMGLRKCNECRKPFTVRMGTIFESSHLALHLWLQVIHLMCASKKGISTRQIQRMLSCSMKTAWFLTHRIREAMRAGELAVPFGSGGGAVEVDETYIGHKKNATGLRRTAHMWGVLSLVDRNTRAICSFVFEDFRKDQLHPIIRANISREARLMTDEAPMYKKLGREFAEHGTTMHGLDRYVDRDDPTIHSNTVEGAFSIFKRGMRGIYQHCQSQHLHRYLAEFDFRYSNRAALEISDTMRAAIALQGVKGKRLTYTAANGQQAGNA
ncbi:MAG: IS1595 family transposase [Novosphingobium sp.]|nr:IS1595 family transposase [Novosphingobium sp.]